MTKLSLPRWPLPPAQHGLLRRHLAPGGKARQTLRYRTIYGILHSEVPLSSRKERRVGGFGNIARAFASRNYRIYVTGNAISLTGTWLQRVAVGWLAWQLSHSGTWLGLVAFADLFPTVVLSPWAGALADRRDRVRVIWLSQVVAMTQATLLALLTATDIITIWSLFALAVL